MNTIYHRLSEEEREDISRRLWADETLSDIAQALDRSVSTVSREVKNNCRYKRCYRATRAHRGAMAIRHRQKQPKKLDQHPWLQAMVLLQLKTRRWSPEQIAKRLKREYPHDMSMHISHESIYTYIYCLPRGALRKELIACLRRERNLRKSRKNSHQRRGAIQGAISIHERPQETENRTIPGHWEGDLLMGSKKSNSALGTLVDRTSRYLLLVPLEKHDAHTTRKAFSQALKAIPEHLKKSLTYDRDSEMAEHQLFTRETKIQVYFADPHSPWQRGTNENTNGLLRQFFPKGIDFGMIAKEDIQHVQNLMNDRPRKVLDFLKPNEVFSSMLTHRDFALEG